MTSIIFLNLQAYMFHQNTTDEHARCSEISKNQMTSLEFASGSKSHSDWSLLGGTTT